MATMREVGEEGRKRRRVEKDHADPVSTALCQLRRVRTQEDEQRTLEACRGDVAVAMQAREERTRRRDAYFMSTSSGRCTSMAESLSACRWPVKRIAASRHGDRRGEKRRGGRPERS